MARHLTKSAVRLFDATHNKSTCCQFADGKVGAVHPCRFSHACSLQDAYGATSNRWPRRRVAGGGFSCALTNSQKKPPPERLYKVGARLHGRGGYRSSPGGRNPDSHTSGCRPGSSGRADTVTAHRRTCGPLDVALEPTVSTGGESCRFRERGPRHTACMGH